MDDLITCIFSAFSGRLHPGIGNITRCTYDKKNGGEFDGPCWECMEMAEYFADKSWTNLSAAELRQHGDTDSLFTVAAYCYFLPAYLTAAIRDPSVADVCVDHLSFRFGPDDAWGKQRLGEIFQVLQPREITAVQGYFQRVEGQTLDPDEHRSRALHNLDTVLTNRS